MLNGDLSNPSNKPLLTRVSTLNPPVRKEPRFFFLDSNNKANHSKQQHNTRKGKDYSLVEFYSLEKRLVECTKSLSATANINNWIHLNIF
jgi:hypothetical protein